MTGSTDLLLPPAVDPPGEDVPFLLGRRVTERDPQQEAVELRLGQRVRALVLDRVGRGQHVERLGERERRALDGDLALLHRLEQRGLGLRRGPVDLVYEAPRQQVAEAVRSLLAFESVTTVDPAVLLRAIEVYEIDRLDVAEAYLVALAEATGVGTIAFLRPQHRPHHHRRTHRTCSHRRAVR